MQGMSGKTYFLDQQVGSGGEGNIFRIHGNPSQVAKIYRTEKKEEDLPMLEEKLKVMVLHPLDPYVDGRLLLAWPQDILYDNGRFVGYVMPYTDASFQLCDVYREKDRTRVFPYYIYPHSIAVAYNLAWAVAHVHKNGYVIGDLNPRNIAVHRDGSITLMDVDSFDVWDPDNSHHYKCCVGVSEILAPELLGYRDLRDERVRFTRESDCFSLAIHVFRLLMNNNDPFGCVNIDQNVPSGSAITPQTEIINGNCAYVRNGTGRKIPERAPEFEMLPAALQELFRKTFDYTATTVMKNLWNRATADEFRYALYRYYKRVDDDLIPCPQDRSHYYLRNRGHCPFCAARRRMERLELKKSSATSGSALSNSVSVYSKKCRRVRKKSLWDRLKAIFY